MNAGRIASAEPAPRERSRRERTDVVEHWPHDPLLEDPGAWRTTVVRSTGWVLAVTLVAIGSDLTAPLAGLLVVAGVWVGTSTVLARRWPPAPLPTRLAASLDLALLVAVAALTGGVESDVRFVLFLAPFAWAATLDRRGFTVLVAAASVAFVAIWLLDGPRAFGPLATFAAAYTAAVTVGLIMLQLRLEAAERAAWLQSARAALLHELTLVERTQHERMSNQLHDGPLQAFISAQQDLTEYREGDDEALAVAASTLDDGILELRRTIHELFRTDLADVGTKLRELAQTIEQRRGIPVELQLDPELASTTNDVLVGIVGELITNAAKHAKATALLVVLVGHVDDVRIVVRDDGVGMTLHDRDAAVQSGHIGLSSIDRRVRALGGRWRIRSAPGRGTSVTVELPR